MLESPKSGAEVRAAAVDAVREVFGPHLPEADLADLTARLVERLRLRRIELVPDDVDDLPHDETLWPDELLRAAAERTQ